MVVFVPQLFLVSQPNILGFPRLFPQKRSVSFLFVFMPRSESTNAPLPDVPGSTPLEDNIESGFTGTLQNLTETPTDRRVSPMESQVISKQRVTDHGEVLTGKREVDAMLDLVKQETERIDSRFLEPACGNGNFLAVVLERKLSVVERRYGKSQLEYERYAVLAVSSIYGIDILEDNVAECRQRLLEIFNRVYTARFKASAKDECSDSVKYILERNIVHGDALSLKTFDGKDPIVFSEWSPINGSMIKRRDFIFADLIETAATGQSTLFLREECSDLGKRSFIPREIKSFSPIHYLRIREHDK